MSLGLPLASLQRRRRRDARPSWLHPDLVAAGGGLAWKFAFDGEPSRGPEYWNVNRIGTQAEMLADLRNSIATGYDADGTLRSYPVNTPVIPRGVGLLARGQRTNKDTNFNANPVDLTGVTLEGASGGAADPGVTLTIVDNPAQLAAAGLSGICTSGKVYRLNNPPGGSAARAVFNGVPGNLNSHALSCYMRGTGNAQLRFQGGANVQVALTPNFQRVTAVGAANSAAFPMYVLALAGSDVYFVLNQLEEGSYVTDPIVVAGSALPRLADSITAPNFASQAAALGLGDGVAGRVVASLTSLGENKSLLCMGPDSLNFLELIQTSANTLRVQRREAGSFTTLAQVDSASVGTIEAEFQFKDGASYVRLNGVTESSSANYALPALTNAAIGGRLSNTGVMFNDPLRSLQLWRP